MNRFLPAFWLLLLLIPVSNQAQQLPSFTQYRDYSTVINPAAMTSDFLVREQNITFGAAYRDQWTGIRTAPNTSTLYGNYIYADANTVGLIVGGQIIRDQTGPLSQTGLYGKIGGLLSPDPYYGGISIGLQFGMVQYHIDIDAIRLRDRQESLVENAETQWNPDVGLGVYAYKRIEGRNIFDDDIVYGGVSVPQLLGLDLEFKDDSGDIFIKKLRHYFANIGYIKFFDDGSYLEPSTWVRYVINAPISVDINLKYQIKNIFWLGVGSSTSGLSHFELGVLLGESLGFDNTLRIGYGFDYQFSSYGADAGNTHEIQVSYSFEY